MTKKIFFFVGNGHFCNFFQKWPSLQILLFQKWHFLQFYFFSEMSIFVNFFSEMAIVWHFYFYRKFCILIFSDMTINTKLKHSYFLVTFFSKTPFVTTFFNYFQKGIVHPLNQVQMKKRKMCQVNPHRSKHRTLVSICNALFLFHFYHKKKRKRKKETNQTE